MTALLALLAAASVSTTAGTTRTAPTPDDPQRGEQTSGDDIIVTGARTENSDTYTLDAQTTATRLPLTLRETPQSVSVVTRAQIEDFQLNDVNQLLTTVPGINVQAVETDRVLYSSRGFDIQTFQIDGIGVPFAFGIQTGSLDTATYDHIEVLKGAPGLLSSTGNPSAVVNFVRKRPTRDLQATASAQYGSYDNLRLDGDVSVPLTADGNIRARAVGVYFDTDSNLDRYHLTRWTGYGIVEADLDSNTVVSGGYAHQDHDSDGALWGANPLYFSDGSRIPTRRSDSIAPKWSSWDVIDRQIFGDITHKMANGWVARLSAIRRATSEHDELFYIFGAPDRITGDGLSTYPGKFSAQTRNLTLEAYAYGKVSLFGREHDVNFGVNRSAQRYRQGSSYDNSQILLPFNLADLFAGNFPRPNFPTTYDPSLDQHTTRETIYGLVRVNLADPLRLLLGGNLTRAKSEGTSYGTASNFNNRRFLPYIGATYDLTSALSAYVSYTTIFNPQTEIDANDQVLSPIRGNNLEAGVKGAWFDNRLNASAVVFRTRQDNTAQQAGFGPSPNDPLVLRTFYEGVDAKSEGIELEFGGQPLPGLQATGGYTLMRLRDQNTDGPARTFVPRNTARLNVSYAPPSFERLKVGASFQYQSRIYNELATNSVTTGQPIRLTQGGYALLDLLGRFDLTDRVALSVNVRNVTNTRYITALNYDQSYYGAPRTVLGTVTLRY